MDEIIRSNGKFILIYGKTGVGKSTSCIATLPQPILDVFVEDKDPYSSIEALESMGLNLAESPINIKFIKPSNDAELMGNLNAILGQIDKGEFKYKSLMFDTPTMWMNIKMIEDLLDERVATLIKSTKPLIDEVKVTLEMYGAIARRMIRLTKAFQRVSQKGIVVVWIAQAMDMPKWNVDLAYAPNFIGAEYNKQYEQFFDAIGLVQSRVDDKGNEIYPPSISFKSPENNFTAKWSGRHLKSYTAIFDWKRILRLEGKEKEKEESVPDVNDQSGN